ncbi:hypothetical protein MRX96_056667 [Rhipicephalus microplus]
MTKPLPTILPNAPKYLSKPPVRERPPRKRASAEPANCGSSKKPFLEENELQTDGPAIDVQVTPFDLWNVPPPTEHWAAHKFANYDGAAYVQASFNSESHAVVVEKTVFMNSGSTQGDVVCRTYVRRTLTSESFSRTVEEAQQVLRDADLLHICKGAGEPPEFSSLPLTSRLKQQIVNLDGIVFSVKCRGSVPKEGTPCISCKYLRKALLTRRSELKRKTLQVTPAKKLRLLSQKNRRARARLISLTASLNDMRAQCASIRAEPKRIDEMLSEGRLDEAEVSLEKAKGSSQHFSFVVEKSDERLIYYVAGYVARKCVLQLKCTLCRDNLLVESVKAAAESLPSSYTEHCDWGGLLYPSGELHNFITCLENIFTECFSLSELHANSVCDVLSQVKANFLPRNSVGCVEHGKEVSEKIVSFYILTRLHFLVKGINSSNATKRQRAKHLKLSRST